ncbi:hypothetical protein GIB67_028154 [Kingdonia uniflora]|uniref:Uncharacterized protein n=1 Tax=Kingdonia uniflora TaxID=39325 RepID=A0A7J7KZN0_9MAGN|nr:hypothetical protein GIB67_028154 [Kingdonia uniflora]
MVQTRSQRIHYAAEGQLAIKIVKVREKIFGSFGYDVKLPVRECELKGLNVRSRELEHARYFYEVYFCELIRDALERERYKASEMESGKNASVLESWTVRARSNKCQPFEKERINSTSSSPIKRFSTSKNLESTQRERQKIRGFDKELSKGDQRLKRAKDFGSRWWLYSSDVRERLDGTADSHLDTEDMLDLLRGTEHVMFVDYWKNNVFVYYAGLLDVEVEQAICTLFGYWVFPYTLFCHWDKRLRLKKSTLGLVVCGDCLRMQFKKLATMDNTITVLHIVTSMNDGLCMTIKLSSYTELALKEKKILKQRAKENWLELGDSNNKFLHKVIKTRKARNSLCYLRREDGSSIDEEKEIVDHDVYYFKGVKSKVKRKESLLDKVAEEGTKLELVLEGLCLSKKKKVDSRLCRPLVPLEVVRSRKIRGGGSNPRGSQEKVAEWRSAMVDDLKEVKEWARLAILYEEEDTSKMVAHLVKGIWLGIEEEKSELKKANIKLDKELAQSRTDALKENRHLKASHAVEIGQLQVESKANLDEMVEEHDRLGRHLMMKSYYEEEVDAIKADTYAEEEAKMVGIADGLDGVSC